LCTEELEKVGSSELVVEIVQVFEFGIGLVTETEEMEQGRRIGMVQEMEQNMVSS